jgi:hypothetical protein
VDLWIRVVWCRGGSTISEEAWGVVDENGALGVPESKMSVSTEWWVQIDRIWEGVFEVLGTWNDKLSESSENRSIWIILGLVKLWVVDGIKKKGICSRKIT